MFRCFILTFALIVLTTLAWAQQSDIGDKAFDVRSSVGDLHVGKDADAGKAGPPLYPGARPKLEKDNDPLNVGVLTEAFGLKLIVAKYETADDPAKVIAFYRGKLKKYGKVLECHSQRHDAGVTVHDGDNDSNDNDELKCDENSGPVTELKVGTEDNQRIVAVESGDAGKGSNFAIVYMYARGKRGDL
ncbi:MAG TPA: hypothetical protein VE866_01690 [Candidatus Binatia bacterium]|jgi:hypothetical protein|nr:hypothetical protein [Candidatus Binatia bacterium]